MKDSALGPQNLGHVYVIFRVYNLGQDSMGVKMYVDPGTLRLDGSLVFRGEQWSVVPATL